MVLPPKDAPLAVEMPALVRAARQGDVGAMCRLSFELNRCFNQVKELRRSEARGTDDLLERSESGADPQATELRMRTLAGLTADRERLEAICAGVTPRRGLEPWRLLRDAARAGHVPSMVRFAKDPPFDHQRILADLDALDAYRADAGAMLRRADALGDPRAGYFLFWAYNGNSSLLTATGQVAEDPRLALAYALAISPSADSRHRVILSQQEARIRRKLSTSDQREAERLAARLSPRYADSLGADIDLEPMQRRSSAAECD
jgi:hypothetical protein